MSSVPQPDRSAGRHDTGTQHSPPGVLFIIENDHFPQDTRVFNECTSLSRTHRCLVLAPRASEQALHERVGPIECVRYPWFEGTTLRTLVLEYAWALLCIGLLVPAMVLWRRVRIIHVANPPDLIIPSLAWLKLFGVKFVFDAHDLSTETYKGKGGRDPGLMMAILSFLEKVSIHLSDLTIATNESIQRRILERSPRKPNCVVRNSHRVLFKDLDDVGKPVSDGVLHVGYFGILANDKAAGLENIVEVARTLAANGIRFRVSIVGAGAGLPALRDAVRVAGLAEHFLFRGFIAIPQAYQVIKSFDFGLVSWGDITKNHLHTAMKVMDFMCCAVPVCSLPLTEQLRSTGGIGVHESDFPSLALRMADVYRSRTDYEALRAATLKRFNEDLCWELQEARLHTAYRHLSE